MTKAFFQDLASRLGVSALEVQSLEKVALSAALARKLGVIYDRETMASRGARVSNAWFDAVIGQISVILVASSSRAQGTWRSVLSQAALAGHLLADNAVSRDEFEASEFGECFVCGDVPGARLGVDVIERHSVTPYEKSLQRPFSEGAFCDVCPSCHSALHRLGLQAKELRRLLRP